MISWSEGDAPSGLAAGYGRPRGWAQATAQSQIEDPLVQALGARGYVSVSSFFYALSEPNDMEWVIWELLVSVENLGGGVLTDANYSFGPQAGRLSRLWGLVQLHLQWCSGSGHTGRPNSAATAAIRTPLAGCSSSPGGLGDLAATQNCLFVQLSERNFEQG